MSVTSNSTSGSTIKNRVKKILHHLQSSTSPSALIPLSPSPVTGFKSSPTDVSQGPGPVVVPWIQDEFVTIRSFDDPNLVLVAKPTHGAILHFVDIHHVGDHEFIFKVIPGLADANTTKSLLSVHSPTLFARYDRDEKLMVMQRLNPSDPKFAGDASFFRKPGFANANDSSFELFSMKNNFLLKISHKSSLGSGNVQHNYLGIETDFGNDNAFNRNATFILSFAGPLVNLRASNFPRLVRHYDFQARLDVISPNNPDAIFCKVMGLSDKDDPNLVSFRSYNYYDSNYYLVRDPNNNLLVLNALPDSTATGYTQFLLNATFKLSSPNSGVDGGKSFECCSTPGGFIRHQNFWVWIQLRDQSDQSDLALFNLDSTFIIEYPDLTHHHKSK